METCETYEIYKNLGIEKSLLCLEPGEITVPFFCYPIGARVIGFEGCILYCFLLEYGEMVFAANPETCADSFVYPLAKNFTDFMRLILACGSANPVEQIVWMTKEQFAAYWQQEQNNQTTAQKEAMSLLANALALTPMENPFAYVKDLQANFDGSKIQYSAAYYDALGLTPEI